MKIFLFKEEKNQHIGGGRKSSVATFSPQKIKLKNTKKLCLKDNQKVFGR